VLLQLLLLHLPLLQLMLLRQLQLRLLLLLPLALQSCGGSGGEGGRADISRGIGAHARLLSGRKDLGSHREPRNVGGGREREGGGNAAASVDKVAKVHVE
jgi:hypothetical protein